MSRRDTSREDNIDHLERSPELVKQMFVLRDYSMPARCGAAALFWTDSGTPKVLVAAMDAREGLSGKSCSAEPAPLFPI